MPGRPDTLHAYLPHHLQPGQPTLPDRLAVLAFLLAWGPARRPAGRRRPARCPEGSAETQARSDLVIPKVDRDKVICFCLYTLHEKTLKLSAQFYPLNKGELRLAKLEVETDERLEEAGDERLNPVGPDDHVSGSRNWDDMKA